MLTEELLKLKREYDEICRIRPLVLKKLKVALNSFNRAYKRATNAEQGEYHAKIMGRE